MQPNATTFTGNAFAANLLGILAAFIVLALLANIRLPLLGSDRAAFIALVIVAAVVTGRAEFLAPVAAPVGGTSTVESSTDRAATLVLGGLIAVKWAIGLVFLH